MQGPAENHIKQLRAAADAEDWNFVFECNMDPFDFQMIALRVGLDHLTQIAIIVLRVYIIATADYQRIEFVVSDRMAQADTFGTRAGQVQSQL